MNTILITGGSGKVGFQLVTHFLQKGSMVIATTRSEDGFLRQRGRQLSENLKCNLTILEVDFMSSGAVDKILSFLSNRALKPDQVIHNARSLEFLALEEDNSVSSENFTNEFYLDVVFPYQLSMRLLKYSEELRNIVFISSIYGVVAPTPALYNDFHKSSPIHYGVSKAAQIHLVKELAVRFAPEVRVNCVSFGGIKGRVDESFIDRYSLLNPQGRMINEDEVAGPVDFLVSAQSDNMTGQNIIVDGGWTVW